MIQWARLATFDFAKRVFDVLASGAALVLLAPVIAVVALFVAVNLGRPVIFAQPRPGLGGRVFTLYKFRSMRNVDPTKGWVTNEERITRFGHVLRSTSLDELPSLWNVIRGDMSLVGPRPLLVKYLPLYSPEQARRHEVRPGLTGLAQVNGRNTLDWDARFALDVQYVDTRSWRRDLEILGATVAKVLRRDGIVSEGHAVGAPFTGRAEKEGGR